jgi:hypothetical protein
MLKTIKEITFPEGGIIQIEFELPSGYTAKELSDATRAEIEEIIKSKVVFGKVVRLYGRMTTGMAAVLSHQLSHVARAIEIFDPKENTFYRVVEH